MTATHQLKNAVTAVAFAGRALFLASLSQIPQSDGTDNVDAFMDIIVASLSNALLGMDANDPPKTQATMQLIGSIFSSVSNSFLVHMQILCTRFVNSYSLFATSVGYCRW